MFEIINFFLFFWCNICIDLTKHIATHKKKNNNTSLASVTLLCYETLSGLEMTDHQQASQIYHLLTMVMVHVLMITLHLMCKGDKPLRAQRKDKLKFCVVIF